jgi:putative heme-binding domain-containing protein
MYRRLWSSLFWSALLLSAQEHAGQYSQADIERGQRIYGGNCVACHGINGDQVPKVDLRTGRFRSASGDEELARVIAGGIPGTAMPPHKFDRQELTAIVAYVRSMRNDRATAVAAGDAGRGQAVFEGKGQCLSCHRVGERGSRFGPDLTEIGIVRSSERLQRYLLDPTAAMLPMHRSVRAVTRDGKTITGRRLNEDTYSVQLIDREERLVSVIKADLKEYSVIKESAMASTRGKLTSEENADLVAYLSTLQGGK